MHFRSKTNFFTENSGKFLPPMYEQSKFVAVNLLEGFVYSEKALQSSFRVATVREKSGKNKNFSRSGKSQGILQKVRENLSSCQSQ